MKKNKLLKNFVKISPKLKKFIYDGELWLYCNGSVSEHGYDYNYKLLSKYILENIKDYQYIFVSYSINTTDQFTFGNKADIELKANMFLRPALTAKSESFFLIYDFINDKQVEWSVKINE
jgi:hypothetical protein